MCLSYPGTNKTIEAFVLSHSLSFFKGPLLHALASVGSGMGREKVDFALPRTYEEVQGIAKRVAENVSFPEALAKEVGITHRDVKWIRENGRCVDNIIPAPSTIPKAGQGAFARRHLGEGDVIVPLPLFQMHRDSLIVWSDHPDKNTGSFMADGSQLLLNYCFGHNESTLVLCPLTNAALINHCSKRKRQCGDNGPNAMYRWDTSWDLFTNDWLKMSIHDIHSVSVSVLFIHFE